MVPDGRLRWIARRVRPETFMLLRAAPRGQTCARRRERLDEPLLGWPVAGIVRNRRNPMRASRFPRQIVHIRVLASRHALSAGGDVSHRIVITLAMGFDAELPIALNFGKYHPTDGQLHTCQTL